MRWNALLGAAVSAAVVVVCATHASASRPVAPLQNELASSKVSPDRATRGRAPVLTDVDGVLAYPPGSAAPKHATTIIYLHGIHGLSDRSCPWMRPASDDVGWVVCPEPSVRDGIGWSWTGNAGADARVVDHAIAATGDPDAPRVAVGFSQGAYIALDLVRTKKESFDGLVLLSADVDPDAASLRAAGVKRLVLGCGALEPYDAPMKKSVARLSGEGIDVRFVSLGRVGHTYVAEDPEALRDAIAWAAAS
jgi:pimeloyl-ACP methyl ester carboxylesterase